MANVTVDIISKILSFKIDSGGKFTVVREYTTVFPDGTVLNDVRKKEYYPDDDVTESDKIVKKAGKLLDNDFMEAYDAWKEDPEANQAPNIFD